MVSDPNYVVAYEATEQGREAVAFGVALSRLTGARLDICLVLPEVSPITAGMSSGGPSYRELLSQQGEEWLQQAHDSVPTDVPAATRVVWADSTTEGLIRAATDSQAERIIVGASGAGILGRFTVGSVANGLLHASPIPVALVPRGYSAPGRITRITCAIGARPGWEALLDSMVAVSEGLRVDLRFVTLVELDIARTGSGPDDSSEEHLARVLDYFRARSRSYGKVTTEIAEGDDVPTAVERLDWRDGEIAFVGSSRLAQPSRIFLGTTAHRMLRALPVPLIVVPRTPTEGPGRVIR